MSGLTPISNEAPQLAYSPHSGMGETIRRVEVGKPCFLRGLPSYSNNRPHSKTETNYMQQKQSESSLEAVSDCTKLWQTTHGQSKLLVNLLCFFIVSLAVSFPPHSHTPRCELEKVRKYTLIKLQACSTASL